jgi:hypothetical protein
LGHLRPALNFRSCSTHLFAHLPLKPVAQAIALQKIAAIANAGLQLIVVQPAHVGIVAQIAACLAIHITGLVRLWLDLGRFHNVCTTRPFGTGCINLLAYLAFKSTTQTILLQQVTAIADAGLQLIIIHSAQLFIVAQIAPGLTIYIAGIVLLLWLDLRLRNRLNLRGRDDSGTAGGFRTCCLDLRTHLILEFAAQTVLLQQVATIADAGLQLNVIQIAHICIVAQVPPRQSVYIGGLVLLLNRLRLGLWLWLRLHLLLLLNRLRLSRLWLGCLILAALKFAPHPAKLPLLSFATAIVEFALQNLLALQQLLNGHLLNLIRALRAAADRSQRKPGGNHQRAQHGRSKYPFH